MNTQTFLKNVLQLNKTHGIPTTFPYELTIDHFDFRCTDLKTKNDNRELFEKVYNFLHCDSLKFTTPSIDGVVYNEFIRASTNGKSELKFTYTINNYDDLLKAFEETHLIGITNLEYQRQAIIKVFEEYQSLGETNDFKRQIEDVFSRLYLYSSNNAPSHNWIYALNQFMTINFLNVSNISFGDSRMSINQLTYYYLMIKYVKDLDNINNLDYNFKMSSFKDQPYVMNKSEILKDLGIKRVIDKYSSDKIIIPSRFYKTLDMETNNKGFHTESKIGVYSDNYYEFLKLVYIHDDVDQEVTFKDLELKNNLFKKLITKSNLSLYVNNNLNINDENFSTVFDYAIKYINNNLNKEIKYSNLSSDGKQMFLNLSYLKYDLETMSNLYTFQKIITFVNHTRKYEKINLNYDIAWKSNVIPTSFYDICPEFFISNGINFELDQNTFDHKLKLVGLEEDLLEFIKTSFSNVAQSLIDALNKDKNSINSTNYKNKNVIDLKIKDFDFDFSFKD